MKANITKTAFHQLIFLAKKLIPIYYTVSTILARENSSISELPIFFKKSIISFCFLSSSALLQLLSIVLSTPPFLIPCPRPTREIFPIQPFFP